MRNKQVHKVYKVHKVTGVLRTMFIGSVSCRRPSALRGGGTDFIDFMDLIDLIDFVDSFHLFFFKLFRPSAK